VARESSINLRRPNARILDSRRCDSGVAQRADSGVAWRADSRVAWRDSPRRVSFAGERRTSVERVSTICVVIDDAALAKQQAVLRAWIDRSAHIVADYYGMFPAPLVVIKLQGMAGSGVGGRPYHQ